MMKLSFVVGYLIVVSITFVSGFFLHSGSSSPCGVAFSSRNEKATAHPVIGQKVALQSSSAASQMSSEDNEASAVKPFNEEAYEKDRLEKDRKAMDAMKEKAEAEFSSLRTPWKWVIRKRIWDLMEEKDIARFPRPVHHRIPNFVGAEQAAARLRTLPEFDAANCVKVNPDTPQRPVRHAVLEEGKTLLTPQPRLRTGFFSILNMKDIHTVNPSVKIEDCTNSKGVAKFGTAIGLNEQYTVDMVVVGSTAVCPTTGARVGKGEGFAELEWGILSLMGNLNASTTVVVTTVHDEQIVEDIPPGQLTKHDVPVDIIVTPTKIIRVPSRAPKPSGVFWDLLSPQKLGQIRVLRELKQQIEKRDNIVLPTGPNEKLPPTASRTSKQSNNNKKKNNNRKNNRNYRRRKNNNNNTSNNTQQKNDSQQQ